MNDIEIARDDLALDALAAGRAPEGDDAVLGLLLALRTDLDEPVSERAVVPLRRRGRTGFFLGLSAAAGLVIGGLTAGAVVTADEPGQLLYAAHKAVLGDSKAVERVDDLLDDAAEEILEGDLDKARDRLDKAAERLGDVEDPEQRAVLRARLDRLRALAAGTAPDESGSGSGSGDDDTPEPSETPDADETEDPDDDSSGSGSSGSGSGSGDSTDSSGSGSGSLSGDSSGNGSGSGDVLETPDADDNSGRGGGDDD